MRLWHSSSLLRLYGEASERRLHVNTLPIAKRVAVPATDVSAGLWHPSRRLAVVALAALIAYTVLDLWIFPLRTRSDDEERFVSEAIAFAQTHEFHVWGHRALEMPLVGLFYGVIYAVAGTEPLLIASARCIQAVLLVMQAWLCADIARRLFKDAAATPVAFLMVLGYPILVAFQSFLLSEAIFTFLLVLAMWCLYGWAEEPQRKSWLVAYVIVMACATYAKASLTVLPIVLPGLLLLSRRVVSARQIFASLCVVAILYAACLSPWWFRNYQVFGEPVWFTTSSGAQLYLGNNPGNRSGGNDWREDVEHGFVSDNARRPELERDRNYLSRASAYIAAEPLRFLMNAGRKFIRYWNVIPNHELYRRGPYAWIIALSYGPILFLALMAVWLHRRKWKLFVPIYAVIAYFTLLHSATIASLRYRVPLEPLLIVLAAGAITACYRSQTQRHGLSTRAATARHA